MNIEYELESSLETTVQKFIQGSVETSYNIRACEFLDTKIVLDIADDVSETEFRKFINNLLYISSSIGKKVLFENKIGSLCSEDPMPHLLESNEVKRIAKGIFMFQGNFLKIFQRINSYLKDVAVQEYDAIEQEYPTIWPVELFKKVDYFKEFPQQVILTTTVKENYNDWKEFSDKYKNMGDYEHVKIKDNLDDCRYGLGPSVCNTCYYALSGVKAHQNTIYTTYNKVFRNESSKTDSLDRLINFSVRDIMFVGDEQFVLRTRQRLIDDLVKLLKYFHIDCKIESANDPFFSRDIVRKLFQYSFDLKYELLANIPHSNSQIAIGSINLHLDTFGKAFDIESHDGKPPYSGCIGIGFERIVYALYCQHGHDTKQWPKDLKEKLEL